jgi:hypothetical protein
MNRLGVLAPVLPIEEVEREFRREYRKNNKYGRFFVDQQGIMHIDHYDTRNRASGTVNKKLALRPDPRIVVRRPREADKEREYRRWLDTGLAEYGMANGILDPTVVTQRLRNKLGEAGWDILRKAICLDRALRITKKSLRPMYRAMAGEQAVADLHILRAALRSLEVVIQDMTF